jgi:outer membrane protein OmpA-like peptidoglycan-associated protein
MKTNKYHKTDLGSARFPYAQGIKSLILGAIILVGIQTPIQAQDSIQYTKPSWYFGVAAGGNINFYRGSTQQLNASLSVPTTFHDGSGVGLFLAPLIEYRPADSRWGVMFQAGYDSRRGAFNGVTTPCNCPADLITDLSYLTVEPSLRFAPFKSSLYLYAGPRLAFNNSKAFTYQLGLNPAIPDQLATPEANGDFSSIRANLISMQIGAGFDIPLSSQRHKTQFALSPFVSFQPYFGQDPRSIETWNVTTLRIGAALKFGTGKEIPAKVNETAFVPTKAIVIAETEVKFAVNAPKNITSDRRVRETFPIRNYVFFDLGSTEIPSRYVLLKKSQVNEFNEDQLEVFTPKDLSGRSDRQMVAYYNVLNILGNRMQKNPTTSVRLAGASMQGTDDGMAMAMSVKMYLVDVFGIEPSRIIVEGRIKPRIPSEVRGATKELELVREGDRRVSIWSESPELMMEFQSGPDAPLKPVAINVVQEAPLDSYVTINVEKGNKAFSSWSLEVTDESGKIQNFGPYTQEKVSIPGKAILGTKPAGDYKVKMIGTTKSGKTVIKETKVHIVLWKAQLDEQGMRYSILYEFNKSKSIAMYHKYLTEIVVPKIPINGLVIIHGHSDIIGDSVYNQKLSLERSNDVRMIMEDALKVAGRSDVTFDVYGFGEDKDEMPYDNKYPEQRFYNRTVIIDIIPAK